MYQIDVRGMLIETAADFHTGLKLRCAPRVSGRIGSPSTALTNAIQGT